MELSEVTNWLTVEQIIEISTSTADVLNSMNNNRKARKEIKPTAKEMGLETPLVIFAQKFGIANAAREHGDKESAAICAVIKEAYKNAYENIQNK